jgi:hypothetical protein
MARAREAGIEWTASRAARAFSIHLSTRATLITKDRILSDSARHWLASSSKFHIADKTEVRPSRAGFLDQEGVCGEDGFNGQFFAGMSRSARKLAGDEVGSPAVEFALVFPIFIGVVLATL